MMYPLIVEATETLFEPVLIHNNKSGKDAEILKHFKEPSWNNPVIRYVNHDGEDVIPRKSGVWTLGGTASRMVAALKASKREVPQYLQLVADEYSGNKKQATFAMHCFWTGEARLGRLPGVARSRAGFLQGREVVDVLYDPATITYEQLLTEAKKMKCASTVFARDDDQLAIAKKLAEEIVELKAGEAAKPARDSDRKYYLNRTGWRHMPLSPLQQTRLNSAIQARQNLATLLSPRQIAFAKQVQQQLATDKESLQDFRPPTNAGALAAYWTKLETALATESP